MSDIVELVIFTTDDAFLQTLREAVGNERRLWHVPSADKVIDLILAGQVGILVLDVQALAEDAGVFIAQIKRQFPDLVLVAAGNRDAENALANLISAGIVYRFIHKPVSPGRAKLFAEAAVKKYVEHRRSVPAPPGVARVAGGHRRLLTGAAIGILTAAAVATWVLHRGAARDDVPRQAAGVGNSLPAESPLLASARAALAANRLTGPNGDAALDLYLQALAQNPADAGARAGLDEVRVRLWARAENALLEERLEEAATAIETARRSGVDSGRIALLTAQLAKSRERLKGAAHPRPPEDSHPAAGAADGDRLARFLSLAEERIKSGRLVDPDDDSARFYVQEALRIDPKGAAAQAAQTLAIALLAQFRADIDRHDTAHAARLLDAAGTFASAADMDNARQLLSAARARADADAWDQLLKTGEERLRQDRLTEPATDSAKYYLLALRNVNPGNPGLTPALQQLGLRLVTNARRALDLKQYDTARNWLDEAATVGFSTAESSAVSRELEAAVGREQFLAQVVPAHELKLLKSVQPIYPKKADGTKTEGWVELDFTVTESGEVKDITGHAASPPGVFDTAAIGALAHWRYQPVLKDGKPAAQRARIRIRFTLTG